MRNLARLEDIVASLSKGTSVFRGVVEGDLFSLGYFPRGKLAEKTLLTRQYQSDLDPINLPHAGYVDPQQR